MPNKTMTLGLLLGLLLLALTAGCTPPPVLIAQGFAGERVVRYTIQKNPQGDKETGQLYDLRVRLCNQGEDASDSNCQDTMLLENVKPQSVY
ncbi:MAG TPA: hypothetical protein VF331_27370 [Polyangiales bacterium]